MTSASTGTESAKPSGEPLLAVGQRRLMGNYRQPPFVLDRGRGCELFDTEGRRYLDMAAGVAVASLGHGHPRLTATIAEQAGRLMHTSNYFYNAENLRLADELCLRTGFDRAFFCSSGAEANEAMLKLVRRYHFVRGDRGRVRILAFRGAFHGRTMGALALTGNSKYLEGFGAPLGGIEHLAYGDLAAVESAMGSDVAAIFVEPLQGEGGVVPPPAGFLAGLRRLADEHGTLLALDEVQTGIARTGRFLGGEHDGVEADVIALAKGLGGGFPIGAMLIREKLEGALGPGTHGSTFGGNPLASAAARTVLRVVEDDGLVKHAERVGDHLGRGLAALATKHPHACVGERGRGLLRGLRLATGVDPRGVLGGARDRGVLLTVAGADVLRFTPPLIVKPDEIDEALARVDEALAAVGS